MDNHTFCRALLAGARKEVKAAGWTLPRITVIRSTGNLYFVETDSIFGSRYIKAHCAYEAKAKFIADLNDAKWGKEI